MTATDASVDGSGRLSRISYRWIAMGVVLFGTFMVVLDTTIVNLGLPSLQADFGSASSVEWVVTAYLVAVGVTQMTSGWIGDRYGRRKGFITALVLFTVGSALCAVAPTLWLLVAARVLQGIGGGLLMPIAMATIYELFDPGERGRALGYFGIAMMAAPAIGPVLGGTVVSSVGWRWLFLINVPVGIVSVPIAVKLLRDTGYREARPFDRGGLGLAGVGLVALLIGLQQGGTWGWSSPGVIALLALGGLAMAAFVVHALHHPTPLADMRIFGNPVFAVSMFALTLVTVAQYTRLVYIPLELGTMRDISALRIGFTMLPSALGIALMMPIGGRLADRFGSKLPFGVGTALLAVSFWPLAHLSPDTKLTTISALLFLGGLGSGIGMMAPNVVAMNSVRASQVGQASGLSSVTRQVSAAMGVAVMASIFTSAAPAVVDMSAPGVIDQAMDAYNTVFFAAFVVLVATVVVAMFLPGTTKARRLQEERREEHALLTASGQDVGEHVGLMVE